MLTVVSDISRTDGDAAAVGISFAERLVCTRGISVLSGSWRALLDKAVVWMVVPHCWVLRGIGGVKARHGCRVVICLALSILHFAPVHCFKHQGNWGVTRIGDESGWGWSTFKIHGVLFGC